MNKCVRISVGLTLALALFSFLVDVSRVHTVRYRVPANQTSHHGNLREHLTELKDGHAATKDEPVAKPGQQSIAPAIQMPGSAVSSFTDDRVPNVHVSNVSCYKLRMGNKEELQRAKTYQTLHPKQPVPDSSYLTMAKDCSAFRSSRRYMTTPVNEEEAAFPIAFSILLYKDVEQFERLLRAIYRPQNVYCVHVDGKGKFKATRTAIEAIIKCFDNVFMASYLSNVRWGTWTVLEPEITCMKDLVKYKHWKYFINLTGQEFPLKTNLDLVRILSIYNGTNNIRALKFILKKRIAHLPPPPGNFTVTKGSVHVTASRGYVEYIVKDPRAQKFLDWSRRSVIPDETFFTSLNHSPQMGVPGAYTRKPGSGEFITRYKNWGGPCGGKRKRSICIFGVDDLRTLSARRELFANKFHLDYQQFALDCTEELHYRRIQAQLNNIDDKHINLDFYRHLSFVHHHI